MHENDRAWHRHEFRFPAYRLQIGVPDGRRGDQNMPKIQSSIRHPGILHGAFSEKSFAEWLANRYSMRNGRSQNARNF